MIKLTDLLLVVFLFIQVQSSVFGEGISDRATINSSSQNNSTHVDQKTIFSNQKFEDQRVLTDSKLKAEDGSLSRYSLKASISYFGPTLSDLSAPDQPNPDGSIGNYSQAIKGSLMMRYRMSPVSALSAGAGIAINHPFHGWDRTDANNPFISWDRSLRLGAVQMRSSPGLVIATVPNFTKTGEVGGLTYDQSAVWTIKDTRWALSLDGNISWWIYNRGYRPGSPRAGGDGKAQEYSLAIYPGLKYVLSDRVNVYSSYAIQFLNPRELGDKSALWNRTPSYRIGCSYAYDRDIYISPYISSYPSEPFEKGTTMNLSTVLSL